MSRQVIEQRRIKLCRLFSGRLFSICFVSLGLVIIGHLIYSAVPDIESASLQKNLVPRFALDPPDGGLRPEPKERYTYLGLLAALPFLLALGAWIQRHWGRSGTEKRHEGWLAAAFVASGIALMLREPEWSSMIYPGAAWQSLAVAAILWGIMHATHHFRLSESVKARINAILFYGTTTVLLLASMSWRIWGASALQDNVPMGVNADMIFYSISQIVKGGTCLVDVTAQYGCYGEFLAPLLKPSGASVFTVTLWLAAIQAAALMAILWFCRSIIRSPWILLACMLWIGILTNRIFYLGDDYNFQGMPIRLIFPALALLLINAWYRRPGKKPAFFLGLFSGLACFWNLETGLVVLVGLSITVIVSRCTSLRYSWRTPFARMACLALVMTGATVTGLTIMFLLSLKAGMPVNLLQATTYQTIFYIAGFYMLPMPGLPDLWTFAVTLIVIPLCLASFQMGRGPADLRLERAALAALIAAGLFSYYNGRSHYDVLKLIGWILTIIGFFLADRAWRADFTRSSIGYATARCMLALTITAALTVYGNNLPVFINVAARNLGSLREAPGSGHYIPAEAAFIREQAQGRSVGIFAVNQASLFLESGLRSAFPGPAYVELLLRDDVDKNLALLLGANGPRDLLIGYEKWCCEGIVKPLAPWIKNNAQAIRAKYLLANWSPDGKLMHLMRRDLAEGRPDLFLWTPPSDWKRMDIGGAPVWIDPANGQAFRPWRRPFAFPVVLGAAFAPPDFDLMMAVEPAAWQEQHATILSNHNGQGEGIVIQNEDIHRNLYRLHIGTGTSYKISPYFQLAAGQSHRLRLIYRNRHISFTINDRMIVNEDIDLRLGTMPWVLGGWNGTNWNGNNRDFLGKIVDFRLEAAGQRVPAASGRTPK